TTVLGQAGGAWGAWRVGRYEWAVARALVAEKKRADGGTANGPNQDAMAQHAGRFQFRIRHLLWLGIWISLLLTAIRLLGGWFEVVLPLLVGWLIYQAATMWIGERLILVWGWFRRRRQSRST